MVSNGVIKYSIFWNCWDKTKGLSAELTSVNHLLVVGLLCCCFMPSAQARLKISFIYPSPVGSAGWSFSHDQGRRFLDDNCPMPEVRKIMKQPSGLSADLWQQMAGLGLLGLIVPAEFGGVGLYWEDLIVILEEMGRSLFPSPFISTTLAASTLVELGNDEQKKKWLPDIASGNKIATCAIVDLDDCPQLENITHVRY